MVNDLAWLRDLSIKDEVKWLSDDRLWADLTFKDERSGNIGEFAIAHGPEGYRVERDILKMT